MLQHGPIVPPTIPGRDAPEDGVIYSIGGVSRARRLLIGDPIPENRAKLAGKQPL